MPPTGSYRIAEQIGQWVTYADVTLSPIVLPDGYKMVTLAPDVTTQLSEAELTGIAFGATHAFCALLQSDGMGILIRHIDTQSVDTSPMALAFVTCHAVFNAFGSSSAAAPVFDRSSRSFVFPPGT